jgi:uncharacterized protein
VSIPETCGLALALEHNGDLYSCDHFVEPGYKLGNIREKKMIDLIVLPQQREFGLAKRDTLPRVLPGVRRALRLPRRMPQGPVHRRAGGEPGLHYLCPSYKAFFGHIRPAMDAMCQLLRAGRAPAQVIDRYAKADAQRGRNDPCTCGSGRKWKHCHGGSRSQMAATRPGGRPVA